LHPRKSASEFCRSTTRLENAHGTEFWELLYPWHPWSGLRIGIHEAIERPGGVVFRCDLTASDANRWLEIPAWMFDPSACAKVRLAVEPHTDLSALVMLGVLLRDVRNKRSTALDAAYMSSEHFGQLAWQFKRMSGSSGLKVQAAIAC